MSDNFRNHIIQVMSSFFHAHGIEPNINLENGYIEMDKPQEMTTEDFDNMLYEMREHIQNKILRNINP